MKMNSLRYTLAASFAAVFLILFLYIFAAARKPPALGLSVPVATVRTFPFKDCYDDRSVWVLLLKDGSIRINETPVTRNELKPLISKIYANREEPNAVFMRVDPEVPHADFVDAYSQVVSAHYGLRVGLITGDLNRRLEGCPKGASCGLEWPDHKYIPWCLTFNAPVVTSLKSPIQK
jgi:biopolymer transport protein ExbD